VRGDRVSISSWHHWKGAVHFSGQDWDSKQLMHFECHGKNRKSDEESGSCIHLPSPTQSKEFCFEIGAQLNNFSGPWHA
jgi:hypothetical protein